MRRSFASILFGAFAFAAPLLLSAPASANTISSCGNIELAATAQCQVVVSGGCAAQCTPVSFTAACEGECTASIQGTCNESCEATCTGHCTADPGSFDCEGECSGQCDANCSSYCAAHAGDASCMANCQGSCTGECHGKCTATPPSADCNAKCSASCTGTCNVSANIDCDVSCQAKLSGGCNVQCMDPKGALFCNGQYVDVGGSLDDCVKQIEAELNIKVSGYADASCSGNTCEADAGASASCAASPLGPTGLGGYAIAGVLAAIGAVVARRRRKNAKPNAS